MSRGRTAFGILIVTSLLFGHLLRAEDLLLVHASGQVLLKRPEWPRPQSVRTGTALEWMDLLNLKADANAMVLCPDLETIWRPTPGKLRGASAGCPPGTRKLLLRNGQRVLQPRGALNGEGITAPRGFILTANPLLKWHRIGSATKYEVRVAPEAEPDRPVWGPVLVQGLEVLYPSGKAIHVLLPSVAYQVQVRPHGSKVFTASEVPFVVLEPGERKNLERSLMKLRNTVREMIPLAIARAARQAAEGVYGDALVEIDSVRKRADSAAVELLGARYAEELGLHAEAASRYVQTSKQAQTEGSLLVQAKALEGAARIEVNRDLRKGHLEKALELWQVLGEKEAIARVQQILAQEK